VKDVIQTRMANKLFKCIVNIGKSYVYVYNNAECNKILNLLINHVNQNTGDDCNNDKNDDDDTKIRQVRQSVRQQ
jgi:hypothetical protein